MNLQPVMDFCHKKGLFLAVCVLAGTGVAKAEDAQQNKAAAAFPLSLAGTNTVEIGAICNLNITNVLFKFVNTKSVPVRITRMIPTCSCISGHAPTNDIPPKGEVVVTVQLDAKTLHGDFNRGIWVQAGNESALLLLTLTGRAAPLFEADPGWSLTMKFYHPRDVRTNHFLVAASQAGAFLGTPKVLTNGAVSVAVSVLTNSTQPVAKYDIVTQTLPLSYGNPSAVLVFPVDGNVPVDHTVSIRLQAVVGFELLASPSEFLLRPSSVMQTFNLVLRGHARTMDPGKLEWSPKLDGMVVSGVPVSQSRDMRVTIEVTPEAAKTMLAKGPFEVCFAYPDHKPTSIFLSANARPQQEEAAGGAFGRGHGGLMRNRVPRMGF